MSGRSKAFDDLRRAADKYKAVSESATSSYGEVLAARGEWVQAIGAVAVRAERGEGFGERVQDIVGEGEDRGALGEVGEAGLSVLGESAEAAIQSLAAAVSQMIVTVGEVEEDFGKLSEAISRGGDLLREGDFQGALLEAKEGAKALGGVGGDSLLGVLVAGGGVFGELLKGGAEIRREVDEGIEEVLEAAFPTQVGLLDGLDRIVEQATPPDTERPPNEVDVDGDGEPDMSVATEADPDADSPQAGDATGSGGEGPDPGTEQAEEVSYEPAPDEPVGQGSYDPAPDEPGGQGSSPSPDIINMEQEANTPQVLVDHTIIAPEWDATGGGGDGDAAPTRNEGVAPEWDATGGGGDGDAAPTRNEGVAPEWNATDGEGGREGDNGDGGDG